MSADTHVVSEPSPALAEPCHCAAMHAAAARKRERRSRMRVYVVLCTATGLRKIGSSLDPEKRLHQLQPGSAPRLTVEFTFPGDRFVEEKMHAVLRAKRVHGEWFDATPEDIEAARAIIAADGEDVTEYLRVHWMSQRRPRPEPASRATVQDRRSPEATANNPHAEAP